MAMARLRYVLILVALPACAAVAPPRRFRAVQVDGPEHEEQNFTRFAVGGASSFISTNKPEVTTSWKTSISTSTSISISGPHNVSKLVGSPNVSKPVNVSAKASSPSGASKSSRGTRPCNPVAPGTKDTNKDGTPIGINVEVSVNISVGSVAKVSNVLLKSHKVTIEGSHEKYGDSTPLLQHDLVFPPADFGNDLLTGEVAARASDCEGAGIPSNYITGAALHKRFGEVNTEWDHDTRVSTFLDGPVITAVLPPKGGKFQVVGFTYSPWDRNYGRLCTVRGITEKGTVELGTIDIPEHINRGDPKVEHVDSLFLALPSQHHGTTFKKLVYDFGEGDCVKGECRRLYFLYALGALSS